MTFDQLNINSPLSRALEDLGYTHPTPIQQRVFPVVMSGRDVCGIAQTGTGKTAAFGLPLVNKVGERTRFPQGLVVCPTRELCLQITKDLENLF